MNRVRFFQYILFTIAGVLTTGVVVFAITFDSDVIPGSDNSYSLGSVSQRFKDLNVSGNVIIAGKIGIATTTLNNALQVGGSVSIGYSQAAPANSLIVSGSVGIGTTSPTYKLEVVGDEVITNGQLRLGNFSGAPAAIGSGALYYNTTDSNIYYYTGSAWTKPGGGSVTADSAGQLIYDLTVESGQSVAIKDIVSIKSGKIRKGIPAGYNYVGIAKTAGSGNQNVTIIIGGVANIFSGLATDTVYYADTSGNLTTSVTSYRIGLAASSTAIIINGDQNNSNQFFGDMVFANNFRFTESSAEPALLLRNQFNKEVLSVNDAGDLNVTGTLQASSLSLGGSTPLNGIQFGEVGDSTLTAGIRGTVFFKAPFTQMPQIFLTVTGTTGASSCVVTNHSQEKFDYACYSNDQLAPAESLSWLAVE